jgi:arsenate reductase
MSLKIYHNPRCSKSRKTLEIIKEAGVEPDIVLYLEDTPGAAEILEIAGKLGKSVAELLRRGESVFKEATDLPDLSNDAALATWVAAHPIVLERPIVVDTSSGKAVLGRPPENVRELLF